MSEDGKRMFKALFVMTIVGIIYTTLLGDYGDTEEGAGPCFFFIYAIFGVLVIEQGVRKIKSVFSKSPEA